MRNRVSRAPTRSRGFEWVPDVVNNIPFIIDSGASLTADYHRSMRADVVNANAVEQVQIVAGVIQADAGNQSDSESAEEPPSLVHQRTPSVRTASFGSEPDPQPVIKFPELCGRDGDYTLPPEVQKGIENSTAYREGFQAGLDALISFTPTRGFLCSFV